MGKQRFCDRCGLMKPGIETYGLHRQIGTPSGDGTLHWSTQGAGSIELCTPCWEEIGKPKMRPHKRDAFAWRGKTCASR